MTGEAYRAEDGGALVVNGASERPERPERTWPQWREELWWAAMAFAWRRWAILPGTYPDHAGAWHGRPGAVGLRPVDEHWAVTRPPGLGRVTRWWTDAPYSVLLGCGHGVDALELPAITADPVLTALRGVGRRPPAMLTPTGRLVLFVRPHPSPRPFLVWASVYSTGTWMPLPPTRQHQGSARDPGYRWVPEHSPPYVGWDLPELAKVNEVITSLIRRRRAEEVAMDHRE